MYGTPFCGIDLQNLGFKLQGQMMLSSNQSNQVNQIKSNQSNVNGQIDQNMVFQRKHANISRTRMRIPKTAMKRPQNPVSKRNNVIDLRFVLPHLFVFVLQYIFVYVIFVNITVFWGKFS